MRRRRLVIVLGAAGVLALTVALAPGFLARRLLAPRLSQAVGSGVRVGWVSWNPFSGTWSLRSLRVAADTGRTALSARRITARIYLSDVLRRRFRIRDLALDGARVRLRASDGSWALALGAAAAPRAAGTPSAPPPFTLDAGHARKATLRLEPAGGRTSLIRIRRLDVAGALAASGAARGTVRLRGHLDRAAVVLGGSFRRSQLAERMRVELAAAHVDVARTLRLVPVGTASRQVAGVADLQVEYRARRRGQQAERRFGGKVRADDLAVGESGRTGIRVGSLELERFDVHVPSSAVALGKLVLRQPEIWLTRDAGGVALPGVFKPEESTSPEEGSGAGWHVTGTGAEIDGGTVHYTDTRREEQTLVLAVERATLGAVGEEAEPVPFSLTAALGTRGRVELNGDLERQPWTVRGDLGLTDVELAPVSAVTDLPVRLASGRATAHLSLEMTEGLSGSGTISIEDLKTESPDPARPEDILACKSLRLGIRRFQSAPLGADVESIELDWPYILVDRSQDGIFPLSLAARPPSAGESTAAPGSAFSLRTDRLVVRDGRVDFRDDTLLPPYWRSLARVQLSASPLALPPIRVPRLGADGLVDEISPVHVEGTIGSRTRLRADVKEVPLTPFNVYLAPVSQYSVSSGALTMHSEITLDRSELDVDNRVVLSRFGLGGSAEEDFLERELGIPLTLAVALMKDYRGNIELALPFGGDLSSPRFSLRHLLLQAAVRAIRGAVLSPLNALGRVFVRGGRIEQVALESIPFAPGARALDREGRDRLVQVLRVLASHPDLALRVRGEVAEADVTQLEEETVLAALAPTGRDPLRAHLEARRVGAPTPPLAAEERARLQALTGALPWPGEQLRELAADRSAAVAAALLLEGRIHPDRIRVETSPVPAPGRLAPAPAVSIQIAGG